MRLNPSNTSLWIVNYKRLEECRRTVTLWLDSFPFEEVNIISNHSSLTLENFPNVKVPINIYKTHRPDWMVGSIAQCWNMAMLLTFEHKEWCVMSQDDNTIFPGWDEKINSSDYLTYIAPAGDVVTIQSRDGLKRVGWYDERFRAIGGPEADYQLRCMRDAPNTSSIEDIDHIWRLSHNPVGLAEHFKLYRTPHVLETRNKGTHCNLSFADSECFQRWISKYGKPVDNVMKERDWKHPLPGWEDIDWYPSFSKRMKELGHW